MPARQTVAPLFAGLRPALLGSSLHFCVLMLLFEPLREGARDRWRAAPRMLPDAAAGALAGAAVRALRRIAARSESHHRARAR